LRERERERVEVTLIVEKMVRTRLRWFKRIERRHVNYVVKRLDRIEDIQMTK